MAFTFPTQPAASADWMTLVSTLAAAVAAVAAVVSLWFALLTLARARRDRQLEQLQQGRVGQGGGFYAALRGRGKTALRRDDDPRGRPISC